MFDGAANWIGLRADQLNSAGDVGAQLKKELLEAKSAIEASRDELDSGAQIYVKQLARIKELNDDDVQKNIDEIRTTANAMADAMNKSPLIVNTRKTVELVNDLKFSANAIETESTGLETESV